MQFRDALPADFSQILRLNEASEHFLSALTPERLDLLNDQSSHHRVLEVDGKVSAFLLAFREGSAYDSVNYRWFADRFSKFIYVDRIVVSATMRGSGVGKHFYADLFSFARLDRVELVACEIDSDPPNELSRHFHSRLGFVEVGTQRVGYVKKVVSLQTLRL